jgi:uncharacterized YccA/Bax inhibitor family protein
MPLWQRVVLTVVAMLVVSVVAGLLWRAAFDTRLPSYIAGVIGGLTAVPVWEFLKRVAPKR